MLAPAMGAPFPVFAMETGSLVLLPPENKYINKVRAHCRSSPWAGGGREGGGRDGRRKERKKTKRTSWRRRGGGELKEERWEERNNKRE